MSEDKIISKGLVPRLRFAQFRLLDEWTPKQLDNICDINPSCASLPDSFVYIDLESVESGFLKEKKIINLSDAPSRAQRLLKIGDIIYQVVRPYQRNNLFFSFKDNQYVASTGYAQLRSREIPGFLYQLIHTDDFVKKVMEKCSGSNYPVINTSDLLTIYIAIPQSEEQQKISDCLSCLDELIAAQIHRLEELKAHKHGLLQQLFPCEGETVPRLRFLEFRLLDEWIPKQLDNICDVNPSCASLPDSFVYIDLESVESGFLKEKKIINLSDAPSRAQRLLKIGDIIYQVVRPYQRNNLFFSFEDNQYVASTGYAQLRARENPGFLYQLVHTDNFVKKVINKCTGSNYPAINASDLSKIYITIPQLKEQQKISRCLSWLDELIAAQTQKLDILKTHKKGLMQQLFPIMGKAPA